MSSFNKVILMGNMTRDPQLSYLPSQTAVVEFGLAMNRKYRKQDGSTGEEVCFVDVQMFGKRAEVINKYFKKGSPIFIEGRLKFDSWTAQDGTKRSKHRILAENFEFIGSNNNQRNNDDDPYGQGDAPYGGDQSYGVPPMGGPDDDIPF